MGSQSTVERDRLRAVEEAAAMIAAEAPVGAAVLITRANSAWVYGRRAIRRALRRWGPRDPRYWTTVCACARLRQHHQLRR